MNTKTRLDRLTTNLLVATAFNNVLAEFLRDRELQGARPATLAYYQDEATWFIRWAESIGARALDDVSPDLLRTYFLTLGTRRNKAGVHCAFRALKVWLRWAWGEYDLSGDCPINKVKVASPDSEPKPGVSLADVGKLLEACSGGNAKRDRALILTLLDTGVRRRELCALNLADVQGDVIHLQADGTKTGKARPAFLSRATVKALRAYVQERDNLTDVSPLFATETGDRLTVSGLRQVIRRLCVRAGIPETGLHAFRRTFALETLRAGGDLVSTSRLLGHTDLETTKRYLKQTTGDLAEIHRRTSPVDRLLHKRGAK